MSKPSRLCREPLSATISCAGGLVKSKKLELSIGMMELSRTTATAVTWCGEERNACHPFIPVNLIPMMNAE